MPKYFTLTKTISFVGMPHPLIAFKLHSFFAVESLLEIDGEQTDRRSNLCVL